MNINMEKVYEAVWVYILIALAFALFLLMTPIPAKALHWMAGNKVVGLASEQAWMTNVPHGTVFYRTDDKVQSMWVSGAGWTTFTYDGVGSGSWTTAGIYGIGDPRWTSTGHVHAATWATTETQAVGDARWLTQGGAAVKLTTDHCQSCHGSRVVDLISTAATSTIWYTIGDKNEQKLLWSSFPATMTTVSNTVIDVEYSGSVWTSAGGTKTHKLVLRWTTPGQAWTTGAREVAWFTFQGTTQAAKTEYPFRIRCRIQYAAAGATTTALVSCDASHQASSPNASTFWGTFTMSTDIGGVISLSAAPTQWSSVQLTNWYDGKAASVTLGHK